MKRFSYSLFLLIALSIFQTLSAQPTRFITQQGSGLQNGTSWGDAYAAIHLQTAIDALAAIGGGEVWVAYGTYYPTLHFDNDTTDARRRSFNMRTNVAVYGGFDGTETSISQRVNFGENGLNETILSGNIGDTLLNTDNSYHVVYVATGVTNSLLNGVTITGGNANHATSFSEDDGGGVYANGGFIIQQSVIKDNAADDDGGGLFMKSTTVISNCTIHSNTAGDEGGGVYLLHFTTSSDPAPLIEKSLIYNNVATNNGGGIFQKSGSLSYHNKVIANTGRLGGGIYLENLSKSINNLISNNIAIINGGGLYLYYGGYATGNTIVSNHAGSGGGGLTRRFGTSTVNNSIIWNNNTQVQYHGTGIALTYCAVQGGYTGLSAGPGIIPLTTINTGSSSTLNYPAFRSPFMTRGYNAGNLQQALAADWSLTCHSDCIDLADTAQMPADVLFDLAGNPRIVDGTNNSIALPDMGAFEYYPYHQIQHTICAGDTFWQGPLPLTISGIYNQSLIAANGCDSIISLTLHVLSADSLFVQFDLCQGDTLHYLGQSFIQGGIYQLTTPAPTGCDTLITLTVQLLPTDTTAPPPINVYENQDYLFFGQQVLQSGLYTHTLNNLHGCDSVIQQQITFIPVDTLLAAGLCQGDTLLFGGQLITTAGNYYHTIPGTLTFDSVIQMQVVLFPADTTWLTPMVLPMGSSHPFHGTNITTPGTYYHTLTAQTGCDSILVLKVLPRVYVRETGAGSQNGYGWNNAYPGTQLQAAINFVSAAGGGEVWVAKGTYKPTTGSDRQLRFMIYSNVELYGGFSGHETQLSQRNAFGLNQINQTILSADINNLNDTSDNSYYIIQQIHESYVLIDGFIIRDASNPVSFWEGAGVILRPGGVLRNCVVCNNYTTSKGGGVFSTGGVIENCTIQGNRAGSYGGGILMRGGEIRNSLITNNTANTGGAGIQAEMDHGLITGCTISHNTITSYGWGGGLSLDGSVDTMLIENTTFGHNQAVLGGGAYTSNNASEYLFADCHFHGNSAVNYFVQSTNTTIEGTGGGLLINSGRVEHSHFSQNTAAIGGGVRMLGDAVIDSSLFTGNNATVRGGGVFQFQQATLTGSTLTGNSSPKGGAVYLESGLVTLCLVDSNTSHNHGGGIYATGGVVRDCDLVANFAHHGGGAYLNNNALLERCMIFSNRAHYNGAGVYNSSNDAPVINCVIFKNYARYHGGGLYNDVSNANNGQVINTTIHNNEAGYHGGGVYGYFGGELINCNINRNHADGLAGGVYINYKMKIRNSVIWGNNTQIHTLGTASGMSIDTTAVQGGYNGNGAGSLILALDSLNVGTDTAQLYPRYIYPTTFAGLPGNSADSIALFASNWNLDCASSLIDRGANSALPDTITHDLAGNLRFADGLKNGDTIIDLGSLEALLEYTIAVTLCQGDTFFLGNTPLTQAGTYTDTVNSSPGCNLTMTVHITLLPSDTGYIYVDICQGDAFLFGNQMITQPGQYSESFQGYNGCDSLVILTLQVHLRDTTTIYPSICQGGVFVLNGQGFNTAGTHYVMMPSSGFCDSVIRIVLTVNPIDTALINNMICFGDSMLFGSTYLFAAGVYDHVITASTGCDSLIRLTLQVIQPDTTFQQQTICAGDTFHFFGTPIIAPGTYFITLTGTMQCDSVISLNLQVIPPDTTFQQQTICAGDTFHFFGTPIIAPGTYFKTLSGTLQCDSVISLNLQVIPPDTTHQQQTICAGDTFHFFGTPIIAPATYFKTLSGTLQCDSVISLNLQVIPPDTTHQQQTICAGDTFHFFGTPLMTPGTYFHTLSGTLLCDSVITLDLAVIYPDTTELYHQMCDGETLNFYGTTLSTSGSYLYTLSAASTSCDSILRMNLTVLPLPQTPIVTILNDTLFSSASNSNQWLFQQQPLPGANGVYLVPPQNGQYTVVVIDQHGCVSDTSNTALVFWISVADPDRWPETVKVYPNPVTDQLHIELAEGMVFTYRLFARTGQVIKAGELTNSLTLSMHHLAGGLYILELITPEKEVYRLKVVKK
jgi:hypothetical protein